MVTRYKQIRIVTILLNNERLQCWVRMKEEIGAASFIRAMQYFGLVKRYGGVPCKLFLKNTPPECKRYQARDEAATYDFIIKSVKPSMDHCRKCAQRCQISGQSWGGIGFVVSCSIMPVLLPNTLKHLPDGEAVQRLCLYSRDRSRALLWRMLYSFIKDFGWDGSRV